ncbi:competence protein ComFA [Lactobacillus colini]|uniref:Competence protein ComFA n=1 Tax=Lactobacillus colini TaxID=1819254 RepID=A0ABS4MD83_9LACO|nr:helicase-related protein [Lactobacillus colini]MBP2057652.1 competence protein ComFA [Lactobacillus colini]
MNDIKLCGRQWLLNQNNDTTKLKVKKVKAIENNRCIRCHSLVKYQLPNGKRYCRFCIGLGRICEGDEIIRSCEIINYAQIKNGGLTWQGKLTPAQKEVSNELVESFKRKRDHLVHAVTGAGKTEMLFQVIATCLMQAKRCCIATPRIDVVDELYPRLQEAFKKVKIGKYHGREFCEAKDEQLIICTTHQLLKFYHAFDLLIIDEVDSFPFRNNPVLNYAARNAVKSTGATFYLSATPDQGLLDQAKQGKIGYSLLNRRFHGGLLPVPQEILFVKPFLNKERLHPKLLKEIQKIIAKVKPLLIFIPRINELELYQRVLKKTFPNLKISAVHAQDSQRQEKILSFRNNQLDILLTTTILERGVTFKHVQVIVIAADDQIYNAPSLVQIAGRVGRSQDDRDGKVIFCYHRYTRELRQAKRQIRMMNK